MASPLSGEIHDHMMLKKNYPKQATVNAYAYIQVQR
jgi:hypothetical protein